MTSRRFSGATFFTVLFETLFHPLCGDVTRGVDRDLGVSMLKEADVSFAVGNSSKLAKKTASCVLDKNFEHGIKEMFDVWFSV